MYPNIAASKEDVVYGPSPRPEGWVTSDYPEEIPYAREDAYPVRGRYPRQPMRETRMVAASDQPRSKKAMHDMLEKLKEKMNRLIANKGLPNATIVDAGDHLIGFKYGDKEVYIFPHMTAQEVENMSDGRLRNALNVLAREMATPSQSKYAREEGRAEYANAYRQCRDYGREDCPASCAPWKYGCRRNKNTPGLVPPTREDIEAAARVQRTTVEDVRMRLREQGIDPDGGGVAPASSLDYDDEISIADDEDDYLYAADVYRSSPRRRRGGACKDHPYSRCPSSCVRYHSGGNRRAGCRKYPRA